MVFLQVPLTWLVVAGATGSGFMAAEACIYAMRRIDNRCAYIEQVCYDMLVAREGLMADRTAIKIESTSLGCPAFFVGIPKLENAAMPDKPDAKPPVGTIPSVFGEAKASGR
jgi:hypothetical protein